MRLCVPCIPPRSCTTFLYDALDLGVILIKLFKLTVGLARPRLCQADAYMHVHAVRRFLVKIKACSVWQYEQKGCSYLRKSIRQLIPAERKPQGGLLLPLQPEFLYDVILDEANVEFHRRLNYFVSQFWMQLHLSPDMLQTCWMSCVQRQQVWTGLKLAGITC